MISRRALLATTAGLTVCFSLRAQEANRPGSLKETPNLDAWIRVAPDGRVTIFSGKAELGQGLKTALLQVAAEQLDLPLDHVSIVTADTARTANEGYTAGSHSMQDSGTAILNAAAQVRQLLLAAAAAGFGVPAGNLTTQAGTVHAPDGRSIGYGDLAAKLNLHVEAFAESPLKQPASFKLMGKSVKRVDIPAKLAGGQAFIQDMRLPGMLHARVIRQPSPGAKLLDVDTSGVEAMKGFVKVVRDGSFLAVVMQTEWASVKALRELTARAKWQETASLPDETTILQTIQSLPFHDVPVLNKSSPAAPAVKRLKARYTRLYTMHGSIGPSCAIAQYDGDKLTVWSHAQGMFPLRAALASLLRMQPAQIRCIHTEGSGCYGHNGADDAAGDAALIAKAVPGHPIRVQWMREQEHTNEPYGPAMIAEAEAAIDTNGTIVGWDYGVWSNTHSRRPNVGGLMLQNTAIADPLPVPPPAPLPLPEGGGHRNAAPIYDLPNANVVYHFVPQMPVRISALRSLGAYLNIFAIESFMDELAEAAGADPVEFRLRHLSDERAKAAVAMAAEKFGWRNAPKGRGFAFARYKNLAAYCAIALSVRVDHETGRTRIGRVVAAVDSGQPINPDGIRNQIEGAIVQAASWTLYEQVRFDRQRITSRDWGSYPIMRFPAVPESIEVHVIPRPGAPFLGTGEAGQGPTAAAIANAIRNATGMRLRDAPFTAEKVKAAVGV